MLGTRGVRLGVVKPGLYPCRCAPSWRRPATGGRRGAPIVEIMIPLTVSQAELALARELGRRGRGGCRRRPRRRGATKAQMAHGTLEVTIGTMIETPRAALWPAASPKWRILLLRHQRPDPDDVRVQP